MNIGTAFFAVGLATFLFGTWGMHTEAGRTKFDEMAGIIPFAAWCLGMILIAVAIILWIIAMVRQ